MDTAWSVGHERAEGCEELGEWEESLNKIVQVCASTRRFSLLI